MVALLVSPQLQFCDANGLPYAGGTLQTLIPNTSTPKATWSDLAQSAQHFNPITLDAAGRTVVYGTGPYRLVLRDSNGNLVWDQVGTALDALEIDWPDLATETAARIAGDAQQAQLLISAFSAKFALLNLTILPTTNPGGGLPWNNAGVLSIGTGGFNRIQIEDASGILQLESGAGAWDYS